MKITWLGHSCFKVEKDGYTIITDPYADGSVPGYGPIREKADMVLCSHEHADHNFRDGVELSGRTDTPFHVEIIDTFHDDTGGSQRGSNQIFIIDDGETRIAHFGDLGCELTSEQADRLRNLDAALVPVGGFFTIDAGQAADLVHALSPKVVIPMHYRSDADHFGYDVIGTVSAFTELMEHVETWEGSSIEIRTAETGTNEEPKVQVIVLQPRAAIDR